MELRAGFGGRIGDRFYRLEERHLFPQFPHLEPGL